MFGLDPKTSEYMIYALIALSALFRAKTINMLLWVLKYRVDIWFQSLTFSVYDFVYSITNNKDAAISTAWIMFLATSWWLWILMCWMRFFRQFYIKERFWRETRYDWAVCIIRSVPFAGKRLLVWWFNRSPYKDSLLKDFKTIEKFIDSVKVSELLPVQKFLVYFPKMIFWGTNGDEEIGYLELLEDERIITGRERQWYATKSPQQLLLAVLFSR